MNIELENIKIQFDSQFNLSIKNWMAPSGTQVLIRGQSGQGKTTFLNLISGLLLPKEGKVLVGGKKVNDKIRRAHFGIIFQRLNLIDHLTVFENISMGFYPAKANLDKIEKLVTRLQLQPRLDTRASLLSLGEQQRVAVARALIHGPAIILADEPTSSLDDVNTELVVKNLKEVAAGKTLIIVSHDHRLDAHFDKKIDFSEVIK